MNFKTILDQILKLGETIAPFLKDTPVAAVTPVIAIGKKVLELIDEAEKVLSEPDVDRLKALREEIEPLVMARADEVSARLRGEEPPAA